MSGFNVKNIFAHQETHQQAASNTVKKNQILFVCTGNIARSASAELLAKHLAADSGWTFASAGTGALVGQGVAEPLDLLLVAQGVDPTTHRAQAITEQLVAESALILVMEKEHLNWIMAEWPQYRTKVHLLKQMARLAQKAGKRFDAVSYMNIVSDTPGKEDGIADPYRRGHKAAIVAVEEIRSSLAAILPWLAQAPK